MAKTTPRQFAMFRREFLRLMKRYGVNDCRVTFEHASGTGTRATIAHNGEGHVAHVQLTKDWGDAEEVTNAEVIDSARHEFVHLLLGPLQHVAECRYLSESELSAASERVTRRLQSVIFGSNGSR